MGNKILQFVAQQIFMLRKVDVTSMFCNIITVARVGGNTCNNRTTTCTGTLLCGKLHNVVACIHLELYMYMTQSPITN